MNHRCPVCFFDHLSYPPEDYHICPCCGTEFENDDAEFTYEELRHQWILGGALWFYEQPPAGWNAWKQLAACSYGVRTMAAVDRSVNKVQVGVPMFQMA
jgi:hypothetical protein